ncbi:MAG: Coenzyme F420:L-glutamate ligase [Firmicutes bacterium ADurb.Bin456]|nr:MAG: Coenzyme F420:L-glutamate ligase [Firmicutes bacterium ADurb.Bin456]
MELSRVIRARRSIRKYERREVPRELLNEILEEALWAPSGTNRQNWYIYVVGGEQRDLLIKAMGGVSELYKPHLEKIFAENMVNLTLNFFQTLGGAPVIVLVYIPLTGVELRPDMSSQERYENERERFVNLLSAAALIQNILLLARAKGLGTCQMTAPKYKEDLINEITGVTDKELVSVIPIGYPAQEPPAPPRKGNRIHWLGWA